MECTQIRAIECFMHDVRIEGMRGERRNSQADSIHCDTVAQVNIVQDLRRFDRDDGAVCALAQGLHRAHHLDYSGKHFCTSHSRRMS